MDRTYGSVLEQRVDEALGSGTPSSALTDAQQLGARDPYSTRTALRVMEVLEALGDRAGALRYAEAHAKRLQDELDAQPSPDVIAYAERLRERPVIRRAAGGAHPPGEANASDEVRRVKTALAERYRVDRELGAGGMATVYLAHDIRHDRKVAVKVLRPELAAALGSQRFLNEIRLTANLQHPNIVPLLDSGEAGGLLYYVMPFVEGESLRERLQRETQLPIEEAVDIAQSVAKALDYAHRHEVIHRDIKPENILLHEGEALVSDFGIALAVSAVGAERITETGLSLGTPEYMSPEQITGDRSLDGCTDVYSLGVVMYEMLAGEPPFTGATTQAVAGKILTESPTPLQRVRDTVPAHLDAAVTKALAKRPVDRFASADEFTSAIDANTLVGVKTEGARPGSFGLWWSWVALIATVVVLAGAAVIVSRDDSAGNPGLLSGGIVIAPFVNQTGDTTLDRYGEIAAVVITHRVSQILFANVIPSDLLSTLSARDERNNDDELPELLGEEFGARIVISGSFYPHGDSLTFAPVVTDLRTGRVVPTDPSATSLDEPMQAITAMVNGVAGVVRWITAYDGPGPPITAPKEEAVLAFIEGRRLFDQAKWSEAANRFEESLQADSTFHPARINHISAFRNMSEWATVDSLVTAARPFERGMSVFDVAMLDLLDANASGNHGKRVGAARRVNQASSGFDLAKYNHGHQAVLSGRYQEAVDVFRTIDPNRGMMRTWPFYEFWFANALHHLGDYEEEVKTARMGIERFPDYGGLWHAELRALAALGRIAELEERLEPLADAPASIYSANRGLWYRRAGQSLRYHGYPEEGDRLIRESLSWYRSRVDIEDDSPGRRRALAETLFAAHEYDEALFIFAELASAQPDDLGSQGRYGMAAASTDRQEEAERILQWLVDLERPYLRGYHLRWAAIVAAHLGREDDAMHLLQSSFSQGANYTLTHQWAALEPLWDNEGFERLWFPDSIGN